jgi:DNA-binding FrmR family transcriptional regulator
MGYNRWNGETPTYQGGVAPGRVDNDNGDHTGAVAMARARSDQMLEGYMAAEHGYSAQKDNYAKRLRRIEGQVRGIANMIDDDKYCIDVLTQISAATNALRSVALGLLDEHLGHCVTRAVAEGGSEADQKLAEASAAIARLVRS